VRALHIVVDWNKQLAELKPAGTEHKNPVAENKVEPKGKLKSTTKVKPFRGKVNEKAVERFNETVSKGINALEPSIKGLNPSASSQCIRCYLRKSANDSRLKLPDTSGVTLAKNLTKYNVELMHTLCATANCKVPPFLQMNTATITSSSKRVIRASTR
jgi:hypothetical protein